MSDERWLPVVGFEGLYEVSDLGRVRSLDRTISDTRGRVYHRVGRVLAGSSAAGRYKMVILYGRNGAKAKYFHDLVAEVFIGPKPSGLITRHLDDNPLNNVLSNLIYGTQFQNMQDAIFNNKFKYGKHHPNCIYEEELIAKIKKQKGLVNSVEAERIFGLSARYIREIWAGEKRSRT